jgi:DNA recombination protein RmuC
VCLLGERLHALGASISTTANKYNEAVKAVQGKQGLLGKVSRFQSLSQRANKSFPDGLSPIEPDIDVARLGDLKDGESPQEDTD